jgi:regulator of nucleoside diphosphate kinase
VARSIYITQKDIRRLEELLRRTGERLDRERENVRALQQELERAHVIVAEEVPSDVVTMHSEVRLVDSKTNEETRCMLMFPEDAEAASESASVLSPLGTAILGYRTGDEIRFEDPSGWRTVRIQEVIYQPEAAGHLHL